MVNDQYVPTPDGVRLFVRTIGSEGSPVLILNAVYMEKDFAHLADRHRLILIDARNRGRSDSIEDPALVAGGVQHDVDDIEVVRKYFGIEQAALIGHSYFGLVVALYAMRYPERVGRMIQIGPMSPFPAKKYPPELAYADEALQQIWAELQDLQKERPNHEPEEFCRMTWAILRRLYVADPGHVDRISDWGFCRLPNERNMMKHWLQNILPSAHRLDLKAEDFERVTCPVLTIHGTKDRSAPFGGGVDWAWQMKTARLLKVEEAGHVPWVEAPESVWPEIEQFLLA